MSSVKKGRAEVHNLAHKISVAKRYNMRLAINSAQAKVRMMLRPLSARPYFSEMDEAAVEAIRRRFYGNHDQNISKTGLKYLNYRKYLPVNVRRAQELELDRLPPQRILDLGSGAGYFLFVCNRLGHDCLGLDTADVPAYEAMMKLLKIPLIINRIEPRVPLPDLGASFDLITAFQILFNRTQPSGRWKAAEWDFFLRDLSTHLKPDGRIFLRFNQERKDCYITEELADFFSSRGGEVRRTSVSFRLKNGKFK